MTRTRYRYRTYRVGPDGGEHAEPLGFTMACARWHARDGMRAMPRKAETVHDARASQDWIARPLRDEPTHDLPRNRQPAVSSHPGGVVLSGRQATGEGCLCGEGYLCEAYAQPVDASPLILLGASRVNSPRLAIRWLRTQALRLARALDPVPGTGPFPTAALREVTEGAPGPGVRIRRWAHDQVAYETHLGELRTGRLTSVTAADTQALYTLTARAIPDQRHPPH